MRDTVIIGYRPCQVPLHGRYGIIGMFTLPP